MRQTQTRLSSSNAHGGGGPPLQGITVGGVLDAAAARWPQEEALVVVDQGVRWTWQELRDRARKLAAGLVASGLDPGDRIGMLAPNRAEWLLAQFGTAYAGLILVNVNPAYRSPELEYALNKVACKALITETRFKTSDYLEMLHSLAPELRTATPGQLKCKRLPSLSTVIHLGAETLPGMYSVADILARADEESVHATEAIGASLDFDAPINIQFTSGTTGAPKAATLTHNNRNNNAAMSAAVMKISPADRQSIPVPK